MKTLGNILWFFLGGAWQGILWLLEGVLWCITVVGIPVGKQCFKFASLAFFPFGKQVEVDGGADSVLLNILWIAFGGLPLALSAAANGILLCMTLIGIPFGMQCFKIAKLALLPFGADVTDE